MTDLITTEPGIIQYKSTLDGEIKRFTFSDVPPDFTIEIPEDAVYILNWGFVTDGEKRLIKCPPTLIEVPETSPEYVSNMYGFFSGCRSLVGANLPKWDVSHVNSMPYMFNEATNFNQDISGWDVSNVKEMDVMFNMASSFNQDLSSWNVTNITEEPKAFSDGADSWILPKPVWGTNGGEVLDLTRLDYDTVKDEPVEKGFIKYRKKFDSETLKYEIVEFFNTLPIDAVHIVNWGDTDLENVILFMSPNLVSVPDHAPPYINHLDGFFNKCRFFNHEHVSNWDVSGVTSLSSVFEDCVEFNQPLDKWDVSNVVDMSDMFLGATSFNQDISSWDVSNVTNMSAMFYEATSFNQDLSKWDVSKIPSEPINFSFSADSWTLPKPRWGEVVGNETIEKGFIKYRKELDGGIFKQEINIEDTTIIPEGVIEIVNWGTLDEVIDKDIRLGSSILKVPDHGPSWTTNYSNIFSGAKDFNDPNVSKWDVSHVTLMTSMFRTAESFNQDISGWDVSNVTNMNHMFSNVVDFDQDLSGWNVEKVPTVTIMYSKKIPKFSNWPYHKYPVWGTNGGKYEPKENTVTGIYESFTSSSVKYAFKEVPLENNQFDLIKTATILDWGNLTDDVKKNITSSAKSFYDIGTVIKKVPDYKPPGFTDLSELFMNAKEFNDSSVSKWDVSDVTNMHYMFGGCEMFNQPLGDWDVSNVTDTAFMFLDCLEFDQPLGKWNVSNFVYNFDMFKGCINFNQPLNDWKLSNSVAISGMFDGCVKFNQPLDKWDVSNCSSFSYVFKGATSFNQDIGMWDVSNGDNFIGTFKGATSFNQDLSYWNAIIEDEDDREDFDEDADSWVLPRPSWTGTDKVHPSIEERERLKNFIQYRKEEDGEILTYEIKPGFNKLPTDAIHIVSWGSPDLKGVSLQMSGKLVSVPDHAPPYVTHLNKFFSECDSFNDPNVSKWDVSHITSLNETFSYTGKFNQPLNDWNVSNVTSMTSMFGMAIEFNQPLDKWDVRKVKSMAAMFANARKFNQPLNTWKTESLEIIQGMFSSAWEFNQDINNFDVSRCWSLSMLFMYAKRFNKPLDKWDVSNVSDFTDVFNFCEDFNQNINDWDVSNGEDFSGMFEYTSSFNQPLDKWDMSNADDLYSMFFETKAFNQDISTWDVTNVEQFDSMFENAEAFNQDLSPWCVKHQGAQPPGFNDGADNWTLPKPIWGSCGGKVTPEQGKIQYVSPDDSAVKSVDIKEGITIVPKTYRVLDWGYLDNIKEEITYSIKLPKEIEILPNVEPKYINSMDSMFEGCSLLVGKELENWDTGKITSMNSTFKGTSSLNANLSKWNVGNVISMKETFMNSGIKQ